MQNLRREKILGGPEIYLLEINRLNPVLSCKTQLKGNAANIRCHTVVHYIDQ
jgi:hypothetical protein